MVEVATLLVEVEYRCLDQIKMAWERLAHVALSSAGDTISSGTITGKKNLKVILHLTSTGGNVNPSLRFNSDSGSNYAIRDSDGGGTDDTQTSQTGIRLSQGSHGGNDGVFCVNFEITNVSDKEKLCIGHGIRMSATGAGNAPDRYEIVSKWANTSAQITSIDVVNSGTGDFAIGSYITVLGAKEAATASSITVDSLAAKKHLMVQAKLFASGGGIDTRLTFNNDTGSNYATRRNFNGATDGTGTSAAYIEDLLNSGNEKFLINMNIINEASKEKLVISESVGSGTAGAGNAPNRAETVGKWANTSNQISEVKITTSSNAFAEGSEVTVYGTD